MKYSREQVAGMIDHTVLKVDTTRETLERFCQEAIDNQFASVCVNPANVSYVHDLLKGTPVKTCTVIGFPLGASTSATKAFEAKNAIQDGADELDMVINVGVLKDGFDELVQEDIKAVVDAAHPDACVKVIIESAALTSDEIVRACNAAVAAGADYVKTSTGFGPGGATFEAVALMSDTVDGRAKVKASTGINDLETLVELADAGATRMGTSKGVLILDQYDARQ